MQQNKKTSKKLNKNFNEYGQTLQNDKKKIIFYNFFNYTMQQNKNIEYRQTLQTSKKKLNKNFNEHGQTLQNEKKMLQ